MASNGALHSFHRSSGFGESGCATMPKPPRRLTSSTTSRASPPRGYGARRHVDGDVVSAARADFGRVEAEHAFAIHRRSGVRVASPWSVMTMNFRPARAAACAISSGVPRPSDRTEWMWRMPGTVPSENDGRALAVAAEASRERRRRSRGPRPRRNRRNGLEPGALLEGGRLVRLFPRELAARCGRSGRTRRSSVDRTTQVELLVDAARGELEVRAHAVR